MWRGRRYREPFGVVGQIKGLPEIELGVIAQSRRRIGRRIALAQDGKLTPMQRRGALAGAVGNPHRELRRIVVEDGQGQRGAGFRSRMNVVGEMAPDDFASGGFCPPLVDHAVPISNKLERTERLPPCGTLFLIWRN